MGRRTFRPRLDSLTDIVVLTEYAPKVAVAEKDGAGSVPPPKTVFFPKVGKGAGYHSISTGFAGRPSVFETVDSAVPRAGSAMCQAGHRPGHSGPEFIQAKKEVGGGELGRAGKDCHFTEGRQALPGGGWVPNPRAGLRKRREGGFGIPDILQPLSDSSRRGHTSPDR